MDMKKQITVKNVELKTFVVDILKNTGLSHENAEITADVLISADRRNIESHGVARLKRYVDGIKSGIIKPECSLTIIRETPVSLVIDGNGGMGQPIAYHTMRKCIEKAREHFMCFASIRNSNHYGIAGYYTLMALEENMIGISLTNSAPLVVPTFGKDAVVGTNPISIGFPAKNERPFLLDMATSTVPRGKLEVYSRNGTAIPDSWACDETGNPSIDATMVLNNLIARKGGGLLPLGGGTELTSGYKGYGLSAVVDILTGVLSSGTVGTDVYGKKGAPAEVCHFLSVINPEAFMGLDELHNNMDYYIQMLKNATKADGQARIFVAGEKEYEAMEKNKDTVSLQGKVFTILNEIGAEHGFILKESKE
ncbi:MAG: Ldh family oxidoreductase [Candidatus Marinimicrobia bacterium]|nr:Ldh family oxidoreductase [Candidatus Neomarinimicrobiota bacterium]